MKTYISVVLCLVMLFTFVGTVSAVKPEGTGAVEVAWNLSGDVMPVPPYGSIDIPGSDTASKLIVNQPSGNTVLTITAVINGLTPNTIYTVYPSKAWVPMTYWPGLFPGQSTFTFLTDEYGSASWHMNLQNEDFVGPGTYQLSFWINNGLTILISDNFDVIVE